MVTLSLNEFYGNEAHDEFRGGVTRCEKLLFCPFEALKLEYGGYKCYVDSLKKTAIKESKAKQVNLQNKLLVVSADKYATKKSMKIIENEITETKKKIDEPVLVEDLLADKTIAVTFPNIRRLLSIYILIPHSEAVVERGFSLMGQIMTKKRCALDDKVYIY